MEIAEWKAKYMAELVELGEDPAVAAELTDETVDADLHEHGRLYFCPESAARIDHSYSVQTLPNVRANRANDGATGA